MEKMVQQLAEAVMLLAKSVDVRAFESGYDEKKQAIEICRNVIETIKALGE